MRKPRIRIVFLLPVVFLLALKPDPVVKKYPVSKAQQAVAIDNAHFYVINNSSISKHWKSNGEEIDFWQDTSGTLKHLNSGIIINQQLYCTNTNYPESPMASSLEIFDPVTLTHIGNHSFGIFNGSATWVDFYQAHWYVAFAHYTGRGSTEGKSNSWTRLVKFDQEWRQLESWIFPRQLIDKFESRSNSGGFIHEGLIYATGHDLPELYVLSFPSMGFTLNWEATHPVGSYGQGIAKEFNDTTRLIWGIIREENAVVVSNLTE